jgi:8-oxo-dGTP pyrophosphatase MutT (NUDIX family)
MVHHMPDPVLVETMVADGRRHRAAWFDPPWLPPPAETTQALGICFTARRSIVLVTLNGQEWDLPGGTIESGETLEETRASEVREEACARVLRCSYIGCQRVEDQDSGAPAHYQTRFWARVELDRFRPEYEMIARRLVSPGDFRTTLSWGAAPTAGLILVRALDIEESAAR